mmetsp:Transcript_37058/g.37719  ORF Transcript_37058/g.37719 Transcript_37058/m.37719 type:complete len:319 (+) Transcript_37058:116-1072(+)
MSAKYDTYYDSIISTETCAKSHQRIFLHHRSLSNGVSSKKSHDTIAHFTAGIAAGVAEWLIGHPLDTVRVRIMAGPSKGSLSQLKTAFSSWNGIREIYRGSASELIASALGGSLLFGVNNILKRLLLVGPDEEGLSLGLVTAAAGTGVIDAIVYKPLEVIKLKQQVALHNSTFLNITRDMYLDSGWRGMYRGMTPTVLREAIGSAAFFSVYEICKSYLCYRSNTPRGDASSSVVLISGGIAGMGYVLVAHPFETTALLIQLDNAHKPRYAGMLDCARQVVLRSGFLGLYRGVTPTLLRAVPAYAAAFYGYEWALKMFG